MNAAHVPVSGPLLQYGGSPIAVGQLGGWTPVGAEAAGAGYEVMFKNAAVNEYDIWNLDSAGNETSANTVIYSSTDPALLAAETLFQQDFNVNGTIGSAAPAVSDSTPAPQLEISGADPATVGGQTFVFAPLFGQDTLAAFGLSLSGPAPDIIQFSVSEFANFGAMFAATQDTANGARVPWRRDRPFRTPGVCAILPQCPATAPLCTTALHSANCRPIFMSCPAPGRALAAPSNMMLRLGASWTTGPRACRSRTPSWTCSKRGSATCSTNCSGRPDEIRRWPA